MSKYTIEISDNNFDSDVLKSEKPVIVDFWAPWCGPCKAMGPAFEALAETYGDRMTFAKCNVDDSPAVATRLGIRSIPTLSFFADGRAVKSITGMVPRSDLESAIETVLSGNGGAETLSPFHQMG